MALAVWFALPLPLAAQVRRDTIPHISSVLLDRRNVFDSSEARFWLTRLVNKLHRTTRPSLISREFLFQPGDRYDSARVAETARNLRALHVFRDVTIDSSTAASGVALHVITRDGWSTRPDFRFRSTGGSLAYTLALIEDNLLGTLTQAQFLYQKDPDRTSSIVSLHKNRLIARKVGGSVAFADKSDGQLLQGSIGVPFFSLESRSAAIVSFDTRRERILSYREGARVAQDTNEHRFVFGRIDLGRAIRASTGGYLRAGVVAQIRREDAAPEAVALTAGIPTRTVTGALGAYLEARRAHFIVVHGYQSFGRNEDVDLSNVVRVSLLAAPTAFGYDRGGLAPGIGAHTGVAFRGGFATADIVASGLFTSAGLDSGQAIVAATAVFLPTDRHQFILHGEIGALKNPSLGTEFDLGFGAGPRAFRQHAFTGDRDMFATAEYRYTVTPELLKLTGVGIAAFADHGGAWWSGSDRRAGWDMGVGLRLGPSRAPDQEATRMDLAYRVAHDRDPGGWVLVVGKGFVFTPSSRSGSH